MNSSSTLSFKNKIFIALGILIALFVILFSSFFVIIEAGNVGVVSTFGNVNEEPLGSGLHLKNPFSVVTHMTIRTQEYTMSVATNEGAIKGDDSIEARASDGAMVFLDVTVLYKLDSKSAPEIYKNIGLDYVAKIIRPEVRSTIRSAVSKYQVNEIYSTKRDELEDLIKKDLADVFAPRGIILENSLLRNVNLTQTLSNSIEQKLTAQQEAQKLDFLLDREKKEAERKVIEARGQRDSQKIINQSLSKNYLYYLYINTLKELKGTIYVPTEGGLPLFKSVE